MDTLLPKDLPERSKNILARLQSYCVRKCRRLHDLLSGSILVGERSAQVSSVHEISFVGQSSSKRPSAPKQKVGTNLIAINAATGPELSSAVTWCSSAAIPEAAIHLPRIKSCRYYSAPNKFGPLFLQIVHRGCSIAPLVGLYVHNSVIHAREAVCPSPYGGSTSAEASGGHPNFLAPLAA